LRDQAGREIVVEVVERITVSHARRERIDAVASRAPPFASALCLTGAGRGSRTLTLLPAADFESAASAIPPPRPSRR
jgi:hypothetical protein